MRAPPRRRSHGHRSRTRWRIAAAAAVVVYHRRRGRTGAYKRLALDWHPDKNNETAEAQAAAEAKFKLLGEALEILTDDFMRKLYDEGYDKAAIEERVQAANRAAREHMKDGCCGRGGCH